MPRETAHAASALIHHVLSGEVAAGLVLLPGMGSGFVVETPRSGIICTVDIVIAIGAGLLLTYGVLVVALLVASPGRAALRDTLRLLPDLLRLVRRLAADDGLPRGVRIRLWLLLGYLALPFDVIPDFVPVVGYADDAVLVALVLRSVIRRAGPESLDRHWPGTPEGIDAVKRLTGMSGADALSR